jgi:hypothetical protein
MFCRVLPLGAQNRLKTLAGQTGLTQGSGQEGQFLGYVCAFNLLVLLILAGQQSLNKPASNIKSTITIENKLTRCVHNACQQSGRPANAQGKWRSGCFYGHYNVMLWRLGGSG